MPQCGRQIAQKVEAQENVSNNQNEQPQAAQAQTITANAYSTFQNPANSPQYTPKESSKSRLAAALLAFFLGAFGAHRFYAGKTQSAVAQLIMGFAFWISLFLFAEYYIEATVFFLLIGIAWIIWALVDFIMILCGTFKDNEGLPITDWGL